MASQPHHGKAYVVTGAGSGMGLATARTLLSQGASVGLCDISQSSLEVLIAGIEVGQKQRILTRVVDITNRANVSSFCEETKTRFGRLDGIANLAGTAGHRLGHEEVWEITNEEYDFVIGVNVRGAFNVISEGLRSGLLNEPGSVVYTGSMFSERGFSKGVVYSASKHAGVGLVKSATLEGGKREIRVNIITPLAALLLRSELSRGTIPKLSSSY